MVRHLYIVQCYGGYVASRRLLGFALRAEVIAAVVILCYAYITRAQQHGIANVSVSIDIANI
jgi:hypothetical protein